MKKISLPLLMVLLAMVVQLRATTISPFPNLGEMAKATDAIVLAKALRNITTEEGTTTRFQTILEVVETVKGSLTPSDQFALQNYHLKIGDLERTIWGDLELEEGKTYFLFLHQMDNNLWQASMLSYAAFEEQVRHGEKVLVPFDLGREVHLHVGNDQAEPESLAVYSTAKLLPLLRNIVKKTQSWDRQKVATSYDPQSFEAGFRGTPPGHCSFLSGTPYARWPDFDTQALPVSYHEDGDSGCPTAAAEITSAIGNINGSYLGVDLSNAGTHAYVPTCGVDGATGGEFTTWVDANLGGARNLVIQFDDPCSEITDLSGCNGTLAIGGLYWYSSTHTAQGMTWRNAAYAYIVVNNGTGACQCTGGTDYEIMLTHEITHSLNIGHIAGTGTANMNPSCCNSISALDIQCVDFVYEPAALPVEVTRFSGRATQNGIQLDWLSLSEIENDHFLLERQSKQTSFMALRKVAGAGSSFQETSYQFFDEQPEIGTNYYRLSQTDYNGTTQVIDQIAVDFYTRLEVGISPNPVSGDQLQLESITDASGEIQFKVFDLTGNILVQSEENLNRGKHQMALDVAELPAGLYILKASQNNQERILRFVKN